MHLDTLQQLRIEQKLRLAPRMIQSMEILQLPLMALEERLEQEMEKNPVLELVEPNEDRDRSGDEETPVDQDAERDLVIKEDASLEDFDRMDSPENSFEPDEYLDRPRASSLRGDDEDPKLQALANTAARENSLNDYLTSQFDLLELDDEIKQAGEIIINHIDADGYLRTSFEALAQESGLASTPELWSRAL
jgi:RNA polymerase sigma-54 factor